MTAETIRPALQSDLPALYALHAAQGYAPDPGYFERCLEEQEQGRRIVFIAAIEGREAAYGMFNRHSQYTLYRRLNIPEIQDLNVIPAARRNGLATRCIQWCESIALQENHTQIGISVALHSGFGAAQRLYIKLGYMPDGYGATYDRANVSPGEIRPVDDNLCLMMVKDLA